MPQTEIADRTTLHWHEWGDGPCVLVAGIAYGYPAMVHGLVADLASDHRVLLPDLRGTGRSSRHGPYDLQTDVADLRAVLEAAGPAAVAIGIGDGALRTIELGAARPGLIDTVVLSGYAPLSREELRGLEGLVASTPVLSALVRLLETDHRAAIRTMVETGSPDLDEAGVRERVDLAVEHCTHESVVARMRGWIAADSEEAARALGDRLWVLHHPRNPWFPPELADRIPRLLPDAHVEEVADGALSRPDLTAAVVRRITAAS